MRIAQVANFVHPTSGGIGTAMHSLGIEYTRLGHEVIEVVPESGDAHFDHRHPYRQTVASVRLPLSGGYRIVVRRVELARVLEEFRPDIVELHDKSTLYWLPGWCRSRGITCIVFSHERTDLVPDGRTILARPLRVAISAARRRIETEAEAIVCASAFAAAEFDPVVGGAPVHIIPLGIDLDMFAPVGIDRSWGTPLRVVMCNRLSAEKGVLEAVRGLVELSRGVPVSLTVMEIGRAHV